MFLPVYRYALTQDADSRDPLAFAVTWDGIAHAFHVGFAGATGMTGLFDRAAGVTSVAPGSELFAETGIAAGPVAGFRAVVSAEIEVGSTGEFSAGAWRVIAGGDTISIEIVPGGVELSLNDGASSFSGWPDFETMFAPGTAAPGWQQAASASFQFLRIATLQTRMVFMALVDAARVSFTNTPDVQVCSAFPVGPPDGVLHQGERVLTWLGSANLGFNWRFTDCWMDLAASEQDYLYRGEIALTGWRATNDLSNRLVFIGFGGDALGVRVPGEFRLEEFAACPRPFTGWSVDPQSMNGSVVADSPAIEDFSYITIGITVGDEVLIGTLLGNRIAQTRLRP